MDVQAIPNVMLVDMDAKPYPLHHDKPDDIGGYFFKTYAIYMSAFDQVHAQVALAV